MKNISFKNDVYIYIIVAYVFSIAIRYIWVYQFGGTASFHWNDQLMINTNDGYFWATGAKDLVSNAFIDNPRVPGKEYGLVYFTYLLSQVLPFSLDSIILYMPAVIASLIVVPIILLSNLYGKALLGFFAALLASIAWSFYNRTMIGYYDSDLFALVFPMFIMYFLMKTVKEESLLSVIIASLLILVYYYAYDASATIIYGIGMGFIVYVLIFFEELKDGNKYIILIAISMFNIDWQIRELILLIAIFVLYKDLIKDEVVKWVIVIVSMLLFFYFGHIFDAIWSKIFSYVETGVEKSASFKFYQVHQTIREAGKIPFETFANRISGSILSFFISIIGYILLVTKRKEFILFLPLIGIGFFAYIGGLRFTVYAVPAMAIGGVYFFYFFVPQVVKETKFQYLALVGAIALLLYPNINHVIGYKVPTVLNNQEVGDLEKLKALSTAKDYTLTWWDYGYPVWYYSNTNTLIDGGKHNHDNYLISKMLFSTSPTLTANLARVSVEGYVKANLENNETVNNSFKAIADTLFFKKKPEAYLKRISTTAFTPPAKTREAFLYLPYRMLNIFPTVGVFSNLNLKTGNPKRKIQFFPSHPISEKNGQIVLANGIRLDLLKNEVRIGRDKLKIKHFDIATLGKNSMPKIQAKVGHLDGTLSVVYLKSYNKMIVMDNKTYNSAYVQMFMLGKYDKNLFELVVSSPYSKIYKVKR
jgi:dolichyl-diphosphooligosaccharide--protein glycosyltransferase/undecaprenyl-diphosphooligosaccharide--protein glycosyltransferase